MELKSIIQSMRRFENRIWDYQNGKIDSVGIHEFDPVQLVCLLNAKLEIICAPNLPDLALTIAPGKNADILDDVIGFYCPATDRLSLDTIYASMIRIDVTDYANDPVDPGCMDAIYWMNISNIMTGKYPNNIPEEIIRILRTKLN